MGTSFKGQFDLEKPQKTILMKYELKSKKIMWNRVFQSWLFCKIGRIRSGVDEIGHEFDDCFLDAFKMGDVFGDFFAVVAEPQAPA